MDNHITVAATGDVAIETLIQTFAPHWPRARTADYFQAVQYPMGAGALEARGAVMDGVDSALQRLSFSGSGLLEGSQTA